MDRLEVAYARRARSHGRWLSEPRFMIAALAATVFALSLSAIPPRATAQGKTIMAIDAGGKGAPMPRGAGREFQRQPARPGSQDHGSEKSPGAGSKDENAGGSQPGPGCPYRKRQLDLIV